MEKGAGSPHLKNHRKKLQKGVERRPAMQDSPELTYTTLPSSANETHNAERTSAIVYQCLTLAAMLLLLGSLWVF